MTLAFGVVLFWPLFSVAALAASVMDSSVPAVRSGSAAAVTIVRNLIQPQVPGVEVRLSRVGAPGHPLRAGGGGRWPLRRSG